MADYAADDRVVLTLDAGGTNFLSCAMAGLQPVADPLTLPSRTGDPEAFLRGRLLEPDVPGSSCRVSFDAMQRVRVGITRLGTSRAIAIGAYAHDLDHLPRGN